MAIGNGNGHDKGHLLGSWWKKSIIKSAELLVADIAGNVAELIFLRYEKTVDNTLPFLRSAFKSVAYYPAKLVQPHVEKFVNSMGGNFEDAHLREDRLKKSEAERLDGLLDAAYDYTIAGAVGLGSMIATERGLSKITKTGELPVWSWATDAVVHTGIVAYMATPSMKPTTEKIRGTIANAMTAAGWSEEKAKQDSSFVTVYMVPNYVNWVSNTALSTAMYYGESKKMWKPEEGLFKNLSELAKKLGIGTGAQAAFG